MDWLLGLAAVGAGSTPLYLVRRYGLPRPPTPSSAVSVSVSVCGYLSIGSSVSLTLYLWMLGPTCLRASFMLRANLEPCNRAKRRPPGSAADGGVWRGEIQYDPSSERKGSCARAAQPALAR